MRLRTLKNSSLLKTQTKTLMSTQMLTTARVVSPTANSLSKIPQLPPLPLIKLLPLPIPTDRGTARSAKAAPATGMANMRLRRRTAARIRTSTSWRRQLPPPPQRCNSADRHSGRAEVSAGEAAIGVLRPPSVVVSFDGYVPCLVFV